MITIFENLRAIDEAQHRDIEVVIKRIREGGKATRKKVEKIRAAETKDERNKIKLTLPAILFNGVFSKRTNDSFVEHSGFICLDFDKIEPDMMQAVRDTIIGLEITYACFVSPSGNGLKVIVKIPPNILTHRQSARALREYFKGIPYYDHFEDEARVCYESYDPDIYHNPNSTVFNVLWTEPEEPRIKSEDIVTDFDRIYDNIKRWLQKKGEEYFDGNKYKFLVRFAAACNRYGVDRYVATDKLFADYANATSESVKYDDFKTIVKNIYNRYPHQHNTAGFDLKDSPISKDDSINVDDMEQEILETEFRVDDIIYLADIEELMINGFHHGIAVGGTTYMPAIDDRWKWKLADLTVMNGIANQGKTTLMLYLMMIKSVKEKAKWAVFTPEQNPPADFYNQLIQMYIGKPTAKGSYQMSFEEYKQGMEFVRDHFFYLYPERDEPTPDYIMKRFEQAIRKHGVIGCMTDPFNQLYHDWGKRDDQYISKYLTDMKRFAINTNTYKIICAHPKGNLFKVPSGWNAGNIARPTMFDLAGGAMWGNKADNILCTYRPLFLTDNKNPRVEFYSDKIKKQSLVGTPGMVVLQYDWKSARFYDDKNFSPLDKFKRIDLPKQDFIIDPEPELEEAPF